MSTDTDSDLADAAGEPPVIRIRRAELAIAQLRQEFMEWWAKYVASFKGHLQERDIREVVRNYGISKQEVVIAEARLEQAMAEMAEFNERSHSLSDSGVDRDSV